MKIMYLLFSFTVGGTERLVADICNEIVNRNYSVHLYIVNDLISEELLETLDKGVHVELQKRPVNGGKKIETIFRIASYVRKHKIDIVHCNSFNSPELLILSKLINPKTKIIHTIHGMNQCLKLGKKRVIFRNLLCDCFIGISECVKNDIIVSGLCKKKTVKIYNGISIDKFNSATRKLFNYDEIIIGCVARIMPSIKGQDVLIDAVKLLIDKYPNIKCYFAGGVSEKERGNYTSLLKRIENYDMCKNVVFLGNVSDIPAFLNTIDLCVIPSRSEGFGLTMIEAMAMGVPCIASNIEGPAEIAQNEQMGILFEAGNEQELARCIELVIKQYPMFKDMAWENKGNVMRRYSVSNMCEQLLEVYSGRILYGND